MKKNGKKIIKIFKWKTLFFIMNITSEIDDNVKNTFTNILGVFGTILTTSIYTPQIYRSYKKNGRNIMDYVRIRTFFRYSMDIILLFK